MSCRFALATDSVPWCRSPPPGTSPPQRPPRCYPTPYLTLCRAIQLLALLARGDAAILMLLGSGMVMFRPRRRALSFDLTRLSIDGARSQAFLARYDRLERAAVPVALTSALVPWTAVWDGYLNRAVHAGGAEPFVSVSVSDPAVIKTSPAGRLLQTVNGGFGGDLRFPTWLLATEPEFLVHAIDVYRSNPDRQQAIGTVDELDRLHREWTGNDRR